MISASNRTSTPSSCAYSRTRCSYSGPSSPDAWEITSRAGRSSRRVNSIACSMPLRGMTRVGCRRSSSPGPMPSSRRISSTGTVAGPGGASNSMTLGMTRAVSPWREASSRACTELITTCRMEGWLGGKAAASTSATQLTRNRWRSQWKSWWWAMVGMPVSAMNSEIASPSGRLSGIVLAFSTTRSSIPKRSAKACSSALSISRRAWSRSVRTRGRAYSGRTGTAGEASPARSVASDPAGYARALSAPISGCR